MVNYKEMQLQLPMYGINISNRLKVQRNLH